MLGLVEREWPRRYGVYKKQPRGVAAVAHFERDEISPKAVFLSIQ
jgi:hypothetical protein